MLILKNGLVFNENCIFEKKNIAIENGKFAETIGNYDKDNEIIDLKNKLVVPGFIDIHLHGANNFDFCDGTEEAIKMISIYEGQHGITNICPTTTTLPKQKLIKIVKNISSVKLSEGAKITGINIEGPFINKIKKGAQNGNYIISCNIDFFKKLLAESNNLIKFVDIAPEIDGAIDFINFINDLNKTNKNKLKISIAHTDADYDTVYNATKKGVHHFTHLYNAMRETTHREPNILGAAFDDSKSNVELICDGVHINNTIIKMTFKLFENRIIMISDSMRATGLINGIYKFADQNVKVFGNVATLNNNTIAGSVTNLFDCFKYVVKNVGIKIETALNSCTHLPAKELDIFDDVGSITIGKIADFLILDNDLNLLNVYINGEKYV